MYISDKIDEMNKALAILLKSASEQECVFYERLRDIVCTMAGEVDLLSAKVEELTERGENYNTYTEHLSATLQSLQDCIVGDIKVDTDSYTSEYDHDCDCGHVHGQNESEYITLQCPFCEELFLADQNLLSDTIECPLCRKNVSVHDCRIDR